MFGAENGVSVVGTVQHKPGLEVLEAKKLLAASNSGRPPASASERRA
jgi:hypothetical protein